VVQDQAAIYWRRQQHHGSVVQNRWSGYQWVGLPPVLPLPKQLVVDDAWQVNSRRSPARRARVIQSRWPGYQWVGLPPVAPLPHAVVQDQAAVWQARLEHRRGSVIQPAVQLAAASGTTPPPFSGPLPRQVVVMRPATPRSARRGSVIQPRSAQSPTPPPRSVTIIDLCPGTGQRRQRSGHVIIGRPGTSPVTAPRPNLIHTLSRRRARGGVVVESQVQRFVPTGVQPTTLITTPATGYVSVGDHAPPASGSSGQTGVGDVGTVTCGLSGQVRI
jgi:hypothetical protein